MTGNPIGDALDALGTSLDKMKVARTTLANILEILGDGPGAEIASGVVYILDSGIQQGDASYEIVHEAFVTTPAGKPPLKAVED